MQESRSQNPTVGTMQDPDRPTRAGLIAGATLAGGLIFALLTRGPAIVGLVVLFLIFVPLEKVFALRAQKVFRPGFITDLTHLLVNRFFVTLGAIAFAVVLAVPLIWIRSFHLVDVVPSGLVIPLALALVFVGNYWGHRLTHQVPFLWRFHAVHHSISQMDWLAAGRLHPLDSAFTQAFTIVPLLLLGYTGGVFAGTAVVVTLLAIFQHANVRLAFPLVRWLVPTPEWHHWHHALDDEAVNKNFGLPIVDKLFGTAYMPSGHRPCEFGIHDPVPEAGYLRHIAYPFTKAARARGTGQAS